MESSNLDHHHNNTSGSSSIPLIGGHEWNSGNLMLSNIEECNLTTPVVEDFQWHYNQQNHNFLHKIDHEPLTKEKNEANDPLIIINNKYLSSMKHHELPPSTTHEKLNHPSTGESPLSAQISEEHGRRNIVFPTKKISANDEADFTCCAPPSMEFDGVGIFSDQGRLGRAFSEESLHDLNLARTIETFGMSCVQQPNILKGNIDDGHKTPDSLSKRCNSDSDHLQSMPTAKRSRAESCPSRSSPFKVRKEKLGDRISALRQLVAPFGKTDTSSVLMEAIGYIKFLQHQVQTLSVPYMKSSTTTKSMIAQKGSSQEVIEEGKKDLRSRGLCLVPLSYTSCFANDTVGFWPL